MIRFLKLNNGEDIVASIADTEEIGIIMVTNPMQVLSSIEDGEKLMSLVPWLPMSEWTVFPIFTKNIITISAISGELEGFYNEILEELDIEEEVRYNSASDLTSSLAKDPFMDDNMYKEILETREPSGNSVSSMH